MDSYSVSKPEGGPESVSGYFKNLIVWFEKYTKLRKYWATRKAVILGEKLFDLSSEELRTRNLMGPLGFNVYESTLAAAPAVFLGSLIGMLFPFEPGAPQIPDSASAFARAWVIEVSKVAPSVSKTISPFLPPLVLYLTAWTISWGCLKHSDSTKNSRRRCRDAFLYYDGTYGLQSETFLALGVGLLLAVMQRGWSSTPLWIVIVAFFLTGLVWNFFLIGHKFPRLLFALSGYDPKVYRFWHRDKPENRAPWSKYSWVWLFGTGGTVWAVVLASIIVQMLLSWGIAYVRVGLRLWIHQKI
jgi:hypothetical protein